MDAANLDRTKESTNQNIDEDGFVVISESDMKTTNMLNIEEALEELEENCDDKSIETQILQIEKDFKHWAELRRTTILNLRDIADYIGELTYCY